MAIPGIHIVSFDTPYPPRYGGVIDVYFKIKAFHEAGVPVILHCFEYQTERQPHLKTICSQVFYYERSGFISFFTDDRPYIVSSRKSKELLENLGTNDWPILFEGTHCCGFLTHPVLSHRARWVRMHNIESNYYQSLADQSGWSWKALYYREEARRLRKFEPSLGSANGLIAIAEHENDQLKSVNLNTCCIGPFHGNQVPDLKTGQGFGFLYHGNLSLVENSQAVRWLLKHLDASVPLTIAGANPGEGLLAAIEKRPNSRCMVNPAPEEMKQLLQDAQGIILPTFQPTGIKLKLIQSLYLGRFILANENMVVGTGLENLVLHFKTGKELNILVKNIEKQIFTDEMKFERERELSQNSDRMKMQQLIHFLTQ